MSRSPFSTARIGLSATVAATIAGAALTSVPATAAFAAEPSNIQIATVAAEENPGENQGGATQRELSAESLVKISSTEEDSMAQMITTALSFMAAFGGLAAVVQAIGQYLGARF